MKDLCQRQEIRCKSIERSALQAWNNSWGTDTQPDGLGYATCWPFGPKGRKRRIG